MFYSDQKKQLQNLNRRTFFLFLGKLSLLSIVGWRLFKIQIKDSQQYQTLSINNQIDVKIIYYEENYTNSDYSYKQSIYQTFCQIIPKKIK